MKGSAEIHLIGDVVPPVNGKNANEWLSWALQEVAGVLQVGVAVCDANAQTVYANDLAHSWLQDVEADLGVVFRPAVEGARTVRILDLTTKGGLPLRVTGVPVRDANGELASAISIIEDRSKLKYAEDTQRELVANVGHELKTPIGAMGILAETLVNEADPVARQNLAERLGEEAVRSGEVVDGLVALGGGVREVEAVSSARSLCEQAVARLLPAADAHGISMLIVGEDVVVVGQPVDILSALHHLLDNALRYSDDNSKVGIEISADGAFCDIAVTDNGIGIAPIHLSRIFERFYSGDEGKSRGFLGASLGGTGLGLAIVKRAAERNGGCVMVESKESQGTTFTLRLNRGDEPG